MVKIKIFEGREVDVDKIRNKIQTCSIELTRHTPEIEQRKGRPHLSFVIDHLTRQLNKLYKVIKARKGRYLLLFYVSKSYDLRVIVRFKEKRLYVITFYNYKKKHRKRYKISR